MNTKKLIIITAAVVLLYVVIILIKKSSPVSNYPFSKNITGEIKKILIKTISDEIILEKKDKIWYLTSPYTYRASDEIEGFIEKIKSAKLYGPLTEKEELYSLFEINPSSSVKITLSSANEISFLTGKATEDFSGIFIKFIDRKSIYELKGVSVWEIKKNPYDLLYKKILELPSNSISKIDIETKLKRISDSKSDDKWIGEGSKYIDVLNQITFEKIEKYTKPKDFDIKITLADNQKTEEIIFKKEKKYFAYKSDYKFSFDDFNSKRIENLYQLIK
jgi:hypothetical protein